MTLMHEREPADAQAADMTGVLVRVLVRHDGRDVAEAALVELVAQTLPAPADHVRSVGAALSAAAPTTVGRWWSPPSRTTPPRIARPDAGSSRRCRRVGRSARGRHREGRSRPVRGRGGRGPARGRARRGSLVWLAARWVQKEAVLKATGWGLTWDPVGLDLTSPAGRPVPGHRGPERSGRAGLGRRPRGRDASMRRPSPWSAGPHPGCSCSTDRQVGQPRVEQPAGGQVANDRGPAVRPHGSGSPRW